MLFPFPAQWFNVLLMTFFVLFVFFHTYWDYGVLEPKQRQVTWIMYVSCLIPAASVGGVGDIGGGIGETVSSRESIMLVMPCKFTDPYFSPTLPSNGSSNPNVLYQKSKCSTVPFLAIPFGALPKQLHNNASSICAG